MKDIEQTTHFDSTIEVVQVINNLYGLSGGPQIDSKALYNIIELLDSNKPVKSHLKMSYCKLLIQIEKAYQFISEQTGVFPDHHSSSIVEYKLFGFYPNDEKDIERFTADYCAMLEQAISTEVFLKRISPINLN